MRLFVAVDIDKETRAGLVAVRDGIHGVIAQARVPPRVAWVKPEIAHVTLRFIGETSDDTVWAIQNALNGVVVTPFDIVWDTIGTFGGTRNPRVIWVGTSSGVDAFVDLAADLNARLDRLIAREPARPFRPHVTVGRVRDPGTQVNWTAALAAVQMPRTVTRVDHVTLYRSHLSPKGPTYTALSSHG